MTELGSVTKALPPASCRLRLFFPLWQIFVHLALPFALLFFLVRSRREPLYRKRWGERLGFGKVRKKGSVWVFATSLGETRAVSPLVRDLLKNGHDVCLAHSSPAGLTEGMRLFDDVRVTHRYVPFDLFWCIGLFMLRLRPSIGLVVEGEFWPGHLQMANWLRVPMLHINGNLHEHSIERAKRFGSIRMEILTRFHGILTKSQGHKGRYLKAGVADDRILMVGKLKFDQWVEPQQLAIGDELRSAWTDDRMVILIASSVLGEEAELLDMIAQLLKLDHPPRIIWAPRSPQRFNAVSEALELKGVSYVRRSKILDEQLTGNMPRSVDVLVGDSIGEMNVWYQMADLVFVGATLSDNGGHNISEPLALGRPVLIGPSIYGIEFPAIAASEEGAVVIAKNVNDLTEHMTRLITNHQNYSEFTAKAQSFAERHVGATERTIDVIDAVLASNPTER